MELTKGYYIVDGEGVLKSKTVRKRLPEGEGMVEVEAPIRLRTIRAAADFALCLNGAAILCVVGDSFQWGD